MSKEKPVHVHDCDDCVYIGTYPRRHPYLDRETGKWSTEGDLYLSCGNSFSKYIVRTGEYGEYATTNHPHTYILCAVEGLSMSEYEASLHDHSSSFNAPL